MSAPGRAARASIGMAALAMALAAACAGETRAARTPLVDAEPVDTGDDGAGRLLRELELEVLASYQRYTHDTSAAATAVDPAVGLTALGVAPDEVGASGGLAGRWPVTEVDGQPVEVVSRALELHLSADRTVGWTFDQISLRLRVCGRIATLPLRVAQVYVRDSERWTLVSEHLGYAQPMGRWLDAATGPLGSPMPGAIERHPAAEAVLAVVAGAFAVDGERARTWDAGADALAIWPDPLQLLRGGAVRTGPDLAASLGATGVRLEGARLALSPSRQVAFAATTLLVSAARADGADGPVDVRLRATVVLERGAGQADPWRVRMAMVSAPITVRTLVARTLGVIATAVTGSRVTARCTDGAGAVARVP